MRDHPSSWSVGLYPAEASAPRTMAKVPTPRRKVRARPGTASRILRLGRAGGFMAGDALATWVMTKYLLCFPNGNNGDSTHGQAPAGRSYPVRRLLIRERATGDFDARCPYLL